MHVVEVAAAPAMKNDRIAGIILEKVFTLERLDFFDYGFLLLEHGSCRHRFMIAVGCAAFENIAHHGRFESRGGGDVADARAPQH